MKYFSLIATAILLSSSLQANVDGGVDSGIASGEASIAISSSNFASGTPAYAPAEAQGDYTIVVGTGYAGGENSVAIGNGNGTGLATNAVVLGSASIAASNGSVAIGHNAMIFNGENSVALGSYSIADEDNVISVGDASSGLYRRISNVADPINDYDAANKRYVDNSIDVLRAEMTRGIALSAALAASPSIDPGKTSAVSASSGFYKGVSAVALAYSRRVGTMTLTGGISKSGRDTASRASINFSW